MRNTTHSVLDKLLKIFGYRRAAAAVPKAASFSRQRATRGGVSTHSGHVKRLVGTFLDYQMADAVNVSLENTVREAEDLEKSGIFTVSEVKFIFQKRARFEYLLRRRRAPPGRYLSYIKFETEVYKLYRLRKVTSIALDISLPALSGETTRTDTALS